MMQNLRLEETIITKLCSMLNRPPMRDIFCTITSYDEGIVTMWWGIDNLFVRSKMTFGLTKQRQLGQSEDWILCILPTTRTCNIWCNMLSRICRSIRHHFKHSVDSIIRWQLVAHPAVWTPAGRRWWQSLPGAGSTRDAAVAVQYSPPGHSRLLVAPAQRRWRPPRASTQPPGNQLYHSETQAQEACEQI